MERGEPGLRGSGEAAAGLRARQGRAAAAALTDGARLGEA